MTSPSRDARSPQEHSDTEPVPPVWQLLTAAVGEFRRLFLSFLKFDLLFEAVLVVVLAPGLAGLFRWLAGASGQIAVGNLDIVRYLLTPTGLLTLSVCGVLLCATSFARLAGFLWIAMTTTGGDRPGWYDALRFVAARSTRIVAASGLVLAVLIVSLLPLLAAGGLTAIGLLGEHDINFYLDTRPPEFQQALVIGAALVIAAGVVLVIVAGPVLFVLPRMLFTGGSIRDAFRTSLSLARTLGWRKIASVIVAWGFAWDAVALTANLALHGLGRWLVGLAQDRLGALLAVLGGLATAGLVINFLISLAAVSIGCLICVRLYRVACTRAGLADRDVGRPLSVTAGQALWLPPRWVLTGAAVAAVVLAIAATKVLLQATRGEDRVEISAHRGASHAAPENTLAAVRAAVETGAEFVEIDVQRTADGVLVVNHDADLMRVGRSPLVISRSTFRELREVDVGSRFGAAFADERIPTLAEVFDVVGDRAKVIVETKTYRGDATRLVSDVVAFLREHNLTDRAVMMSLESAEMQQVRRIAPEIECGLIVSVALGSVSRLDVDFLAVAKPKATAAFIAAAHAQGKRVFVWTVDDPSEMSTLIERGADNLITNEPALAVELLRERAGLNNVERLLLRFQSLYR